MTQIRRYSGFLALLAIIILAALLIREWLPKPCLLPEPFCTGTPPPPSPMPTPASTPTVTILNIRALAQLATVKYQVVAEVPNESVPDDFRAALGARERITLLVFSDVNAGFDLAKLREGDLWTDGTRVQLHLPAPEIISQDIDFERSHAIARDITPIIIGSDPELEMKTLEIAEKHIKEAAVEEGILENASKYGQLFFENFLRSLGFTEVKVIVN
jgi:hypothetical protein